MVPQQDGEELTVSIQLYGAEWVGFQFQFSGTDELLIKSEEYSDLKDPRAIRTVKDAGEKKTEEPKGTAK